MEQMEEIEQKTRLVYPKQQTKRGKKKREGRKE